MTRGFWRDPDRFLETYWSRIPDVWVHGDWASADADGFWFLHGRSDDTLNIAGKRIGPAELESAAVAHPAVREAAAIGVPHALKGETSWIFCCLLPGEEPTDELDDGSRRGWPPSSARRSSPTGSCSSTRCRRRARRRSCAARCAPRCSAPTSATSRRSRIPSRSTRSSCRGCDSVKTILCYGDSNTWGVDPANPDVRFAREVRWPDRLAAALGAGFEVIAEGLNGRTATLDSPVADGRNGLTYLHAVPALAHADRPRRDLPRHERPRATGTGCLPVDVAGAVGAARASRARERGGAGRRRAAGARRSARRRSRGSIRRARSRTPARSRGKVGRHFAEMAALLGCELLDLDGVAVVQRPRRHPPRSGRSRGSRGGRRADRQAAARMSAARLRVYVIGLIVVAAVLSFIGNRAGQQDRECARVRRVSRRGPPLRLLAARRQERARC